MRRSLSAQRGLPRKRALRDKQSQRWIDGMQTSARLMTLAARVTVVADREGDIFEMFACRPEGVEFLIRAAQDRMLSEGAGKLFSSLANRPEEDHTIELPARPGQKKRKARIGVRFANVTLRKPKNRTLEPGVAMRQPVCIVEAREIDPPVQESALALEEAGILDTRNTLSDRKIFHDLTQPSGKVFRGYHLDIRRRHEYR